MGLITKLPNVNFTDASLPKLYKDGLINAGTLGLYDFKNAVTFGGSLPAAGSTLTNGLSLTNMVDAGPAASVVSSALVYTAGGGIQFNGGGPASLISMGNNYNLAPANPNFLMLLWVKMTMVSSNYGLLFGRGYTTNPPDCQYRFDMGANGQQIRAGIGGPTTVPVGEVAGATALNSLYQVAIAKVGTTLSIYRNGLLTGTAGCDATLANPALPLELGRDYKGVVYRVLIENLTISGKDPLKQVQADYAANAGRFS
jgi:hypothetical protein